MYCYSKGPGGDYGMRCVDPAYQAQAGEYLSPEPATADQLAAQFPDYAAAANAVSVKAQIVGLESTVTPRRLREAVLGTDGGWLTNVNSQIAALRAEL